MKKVLLIAAIVIIFASCEDSNPHEPSNDNIIEQPGSNNSIDNTQIIEFQDPIAKAICTLYWDLNKDGELSYSEASVVTDILTVFKDSSIITFNELKYFTGLTTIGKSAFYECDNLISVTIPDSVTTIGDEAFSYCSSLTSVTIPDSVTTIGVEAFEDCSSLTSVYISDISAWCNISFTNWASNPLIYANLYLNNELVTDLTIPDSVTTIGDYAFCGCWSLTSVTIPDSVTKIGDYAFNNCTCLTSVTIPDSVTEIGYGAFEDCRSLTTVTIPDSVTTIGEWAFGGCTSLTSVYCEATTPPSLGVYVFMCWDPDSECYCYICCNIYVPMESVNKYKSAEGWGEYASDIVGYNF